MLSGIREGQHPLFCCNWMYYFSNLCNKYLLRATNVTKTIELKAKKAKKAMEPRNKERILIDLINENQHIIYKVCYVYASDDYTIEELFQESVINIWKSLSGFRSDCKNSTWIYRVTMNTCISYMRKKSSKPETIPISIQLADTMSDNTESNHYLQEFYRLLNGLGKLEKALVLLYLEGKKHQEISEILGISVNNVAVRFNRIKNKLKRMSNL